MKVLITGIAGFIGSNLAKALLTKGYSVVGIDNLSQGYMHNLAEFRTNKRFKFIRGDVRNKKLLYRVGRDCEVIIHLAAYKIPRYSDAMDTLLVNSMGIISVMEAAVKNHSKVIAASTSDVYGKNPEIPFSETSDLVIGRPEVKRWSYAISKMFEEQLLFAYHERYGLNVVALRFFGGYGPNQHLSWWGGPQSVFINSAIDGEAIPLHGDGLQTRSFTYISDHIDGIIAAMEKIEAQNHVFNLGNTDEITIRDLAIQIWGMLRLHEPANLVYLPYETFGKYEDVRRRVPDIEKARTILGFEPKVNLEIGLQKTIEWQINRRRVLGIQTPELSNR